MSEPAEHDDEHRQNEVWRTVLMGETRGLDRPERPDFA